MNPNGITKDKDILEDERPSFYIFRDILDFVGWPSPLSGLAYICLSGSRKKGNFTFPLFAIGQHVGVEVIRWGTGETHPYGIGRHHVAFSVGR